MRAIDLFAGAGGTSTGAAMAGLRQVIGQAIAQLGRRIAA